MWYGSTHPSIMLCDGLRTDLNLKPIFNSIFRTLLARCNEDLHGAWEFCFIVSSSYVIAIQLKHIFRAHFVLNCLCVRLIAMAVEGYINPLNQHLLSLSLFNYSQFMEFQNWILKTEYWIIIIILFCCGCFTHLLPIVWFYWFLFIVDDVIACCLLVLCIPF